MIILTITIAIIFFIVLTLFSNGVRPVDQNFLIKKGRHYCSGILSGIPRLFIHKGIKELEFYVTFDPNCKYRFVTLDKWAINKVAGFSRGYHHNESLRLGWNCPEGELKLYAYYYTNGQRMSLSIPCEGNIYYNGYEFNEPIHVKLIDNPRNFIIEINGKETYLPKIWRLNGTKGWRLGYYLKPYFGGTSTSPHNMNIYIQEL
jgi:hypothetical protein